MVVGEGWIVVVVGGFVFTDVVCVDLVLVVVVASVVRFLQFFFVAGCYACCSSCCICYCGCFCSRCSCSFSCALLRFITVVAAFIAVVLFSGSGLVAFRPCRCLLPRGSRCGRVSLLPFITDGRRRRRIRAIYFRPFAKRTARPCFRSDRTLPAHGGIDQTATFSPARSPRPSP